jgi:hypothetical protein
MYSINTSGYQKKTLTLLYYYHSSYPTSFEFIPTTIVRDPAVFDMVTGITTAAAVCSSQAIDLDFTEDCC